MARSTSPAVRPQEESRYDVAPVRRDTGGLRDALFDELDALREGRSNSSKANATAKLCATVIESVRMELEVRKYLQTAPAAGDAPQAALGAPIDLGL